MDKADIYKEACTCLAEEWERRKPAGCHSLKPVGYKHRGVFRGLPITVRQMPCLGVMPTTAIHEAAANRYRENVDFKLEVYFYAFDFDIDQEITDVLLMSRAIEDIIGNNRTLNGKLDVWFIENIDYGGMIRKSADGTDFVAAGGVATVICRKQG